MLVKETSTDDPFKAFQIPKQYNSCCQARSAMLYNILFHAVTSLGHVTFVHLYLKGKLKCCNNSFTGAESPVVDANGNSFDFTTKLLHLAWHPTENSIACAAANSLYMYYA